MCVCGEGWGEFFFKKMTYPGRKLRIVDAGDGGGESGVGCGSDLDVDFLGALRNVLEKINAKKYFNHFLYWRCVASCVNK